MRKRRSESRPAHCLRIPFYHLMISERSSLSASTAGKRRSHAMSHSRCVVVLVLSQAVSSCLGGAPIQCDDWNTEAFIETAGASEVRACLDSGADLEARGMLLQTSLHLAARTRNVEAAEALLAAGADVTARDVLGGTPLHTAAVVGSPAVAKALMGAGADVLARDMDGSTPLHEAAQRIQGLPLGADDAELSRRREGMRAVAEALLNGGAPSEVWNRYGDTPLHWAAETGASDVVTAMVGAGANLSVKDADENTPLHRAVARGELATVEVLLSAGADPNAEAGLSFVRSTFVRDRHIFRTPLHVAAARADAPATEALLRAGADPNARNLVYLAIEHDAVAVMNALLGAGAELPSHTLHVAIDQGAWTIVEPLLRAGASPDERGGPGAHTPLLEAARNAVPDVVEILLAGGADPNARDDFADVTPLHETVWNDGSSEAIAELLIAAGADVNARTVVGETPLSMARRAENLPLASLLLRHGGHS